MIHHRERPLFLLKSAHHDKAVHSSVHELDRHFALNRLQLFGKVNITHATMSDQFANMVRTNSGVLQKAD